MITRTPRVLLTLSSFLAALGAVMHALAYKKAVAAVDASNLATFFGKSLKGLWLGDSATLILVAAIFAWIAAKPASATRPTVLLVALIPAATAVLLYVFLGNFFAGHLLLLIAALGFVAGLQFPESRN